MNSANLARRLKTVCATTITPFQGDTKQIDWNGLETHVNFLIERGINVIVACGNTGEFYALTLREAQAVTKRVVEVARGRATVIAGIGYSVDTAIELGQFAAGVGADAVLIHQPVHPYVTDRGVTAYLRNISEALDVPSVLYFKDPNTSDTVLMELAALPKLIGVKYAINDLPRFAKLVREAPREHPLTWICGTAEKWAPFFFHAGATGFTSGLVNVCPEKSLAMLRALRAGDWDTVWRVWLETLPFENLRAKYNSGNNVVVVKEAMAQIGLPAGVPREPVGPLDEQDKAEVRQILQRWGLLPRSGA
jgi:4-hydroxy-tetrahydrodipicolinate synthase